MENPENKNKSERALREEAVLKFWKENKIFEKSLEKEAPNGEFVFYDGPPFATGLPHYGHILPGTIKDVIPRYKTMKGYKVPRRWGWDCHGLPIENLVEKELGLETKKDIEKFGIGEFNKRARSSVLTYEKDWKEIIPRTGRWIDMENSYKTMDSSYTESVWWSFKTLYDKNLVYQGFKSMHLCPHCETTLSNFEVNQGYKDITDISVYAKFELIDEPKTFLIAWTTTPWTLPGNVALAVKPGSVYVKAEKDGEFYIVLKILAEKVLKENFKILEDISAEKLAGKKYKTLFDYYSNEGQVYLADFVQEEEGTGIVHIAPGFGEEDYLLSLENNLPLIQHVSMDGRFKQEVRDFAGEKVKPKDDHQATDIKIIKYLASKNLLFAKEKVIHSYPHCWRCDTPLLNYAAHSWFVKVSEIKDKILKNNSLVKWVPEDIRDGRFGKWLEGARDWAVSRSRFWGTPLPVWKNKDDSKRIVVDSLETLKQYSKKSENRYFIMRHGGTESNKKDVVSFKKESDDHLTDDGKQEVLKSIKAFKDAKIDLIISSPFTRTKETAEIVRVELGLEDVLVDERLREVNPGEFDGKNWDEYHSYVENKGPNWFDESIPGGESLKEVGQRVASNLYELESKYKNKNILLVTHGGPAWLAYVASGLYRPENEDYEKAGEHVFVNKFKKFDNAEIRELPFVPLPHDEDFNLDFHRPYIDEFILEKDGEDYKRIEEVFDTWYDSGSVPFASRASKDFRPADFIAEGLDQTRGWFYTMIVLSTALFGDSPYKQVVVNGLILAEDGKKMSKKLKNYPEITQVLNNYGADALRYYLLSSPAVRAEDLAFSEKGLDEVSKKIFGRLDNVVSFYQLYSVDKPDSEANSNHVLDRWIDARFNKFLNEVSTSLEAYELDRASRPINDFIDDLSTWYLRRSRTRTEALPKLKQILIDLAKVMAPFSPFIAEDIYQKLRNSNDPESVHLALWPDTKEINKELLEKMDKTREITSLALEARSKANIKVRQPLNELKIKSIELGEEFLELIKDELNVKKVTVDESLTTEVELDTNITKELEEEGRVRDIMRTIQDLRKEKGLKPEDKMSYEVPEESKELFAKFGDEIKRVTNIEFN